MKRILCYKEDDQMYYTRYIVFETDCDLNILELENLSWSVPGAGRMSTSFETFKLLVEAKEYRIRILKKYGKTDTPPREGEYEMIVGATGNY